MSGDPSPHGALRHFLLCFVFSRSILSLKSHCVIIVIMFLTLWAAIFCELTVNNCMQIIQYVVLKTKKSVNYIIWCNILNSSTMSHKLVSCYIKSVIFVQPLKDCWSWPKICFLPKNEQFSLFHILFSFWCSV